LDLNLQEPKAIVQSLMAKDAQSDVALDGLKVVKACPASWNGMKGTDQVRFCTQCSLKVYNISNMDRQVAENLIGNPEGRVCVRYYLRPDGKIMTADCPTAIRKRVKFMSILTSIFSVFGVAWVSPVMGAAKASNSVILKSEVRQLREVDNDLQHPEPRDDRKALLETQSNLRKRIKAVAEQIRAEKPSSY